MRKALNWRLLAAMSIAVPFTFQAQNAAAGTQTTRDWKSIRAGITPVTLTDAQAQQLSQNVDKNVIIVLRQQHLDVPASGSTAAAHTSAVRSDQSSLVAELSQVSAQNIKTYASINAIAATVSQAEADRLATNPNVLEVVPDSQIRVLKSATQHYNASSDSAASSALPNVGGTGSGCSSNPAAPTLEPEALTLTNTPAAWNIATGAGVKVAYIADGIDVNNPDLIRANLSHVIVDYKDFSPDGTTAQTGGAEAFGDASSIAAQGRVSYDLNQFTPLVGPGQCFIKIKGVAPDASIVALKVFANTRILPGPPPTPDPTSFTTTESAFIQAIDYSILVKVNVLNESFGGNPLPDSVNDPVTIANQQATAAGITVTVSTGDAGVFAGIESPASDPGVIAVGATTQFRAFAQYHSGRRAYNGFIDNNIASFSNAGTGQNIVRGVDVVAPGDSGWALCTPTAQYAECGSNIQLFGGTSESSPLTAGEAALVYQAYKATHGVFPTPALTKRIIMSTGQDLGIPAIEQGAGLDNMLKAVQAAASYHDANGSPAAQGNALLTSPTSVSLIGNPSSLQTFNFSVTNTGIAAQNVSPFVKRLSTEHPFINRFNPTITGPVLDQKFVVPSGFSRLDATLAVPPAVDSNFNLLPTPEMRLYDPAGNFVNQSDSQGPGNGYGHASVANPMPGVWTAHFLQGTDSNGVYEAQPLALTFSTARFVNFGVAQYMVSPASQTIQPGATAWYSVRVYEPPQAGDLVIQVDMGQSAGAIPIVLRAVVPITASGGSFGGTLLGGNGRGGAPGQDLTYQFDVPGGLHDMGINITTTDPNYNLQAVLVNPEGVPVDVQANPANSIQLFKADPVAGTWHLVLSIDYFASGNQTSLPFTGTISFNVSTPSVSAPGLPTSAATHLTHNVPVNIAVHVTNVGSTPESFSLDPRHTDMYAWYGQASSVTLPRTISSTSPSMIVPPHSTKLYGIAVSSAPAVPIDMQIANNQGGTPFGFTGSPFYTSTNSFSAGHFQSVISATQQEMPQGIWVTDISDIGANIGPAPATDVSFIGYAWTQKFDNDVSSDVGDVWKDAVTGSNTYSPLDLAPGQSGTINVTITPTASAGTVVHGALYVTTFSGFTLSSDQYATLPYSYTVN